MNDEYKLRLEADPKSDEMVPIYKGLLAYNAEKTGTTPQYLVVTVRDRQGDIVGGLLGATYVGWLQVQAVWVPDELKGRGLGTALMREAEQEAVRRGCPHVFLETFSFQALPFYEKLGYKIHSRLDDFPPGGARYALTKELGPLASAAT
jgi:ribosomal protein S18 acetylase RimI-like enzyme